MPASSKTPLLSKATHNAPTKSVNKLSRTTKKKLFKKTNNRNSKSSSSNSSTYVSNQQKFLQIGVLCVLCAQIIHLIIFRGFHFHLEVFWLVQNFHRQISSHSPSPAILQAKSFFCMPKSFRAEFLKLYSSLDSLSPFSSLSIVFCSYHRSLCRVRPSFSTERDRAE